METFERSTEILTAALFTAIALIGAWRGRRGARASRRAGLAFGSLAFVLVLSLLPDTALEPLGSWGGKVIILTLFAFPYLLFRFTEAFHDYPPLIKRAALAGLLIVAATTTAIPITADESESPGMLGYLVVVLFYWTFVSSVTGIQLWGAGRGQPSLARKRMRLMSVATLGLNLVLIFGVVPGGDSNTASVIVQIAVLVTGVSFLLGFSPPRILRYAWREPEETALREAVQQLMKADTLQEVSDLLLPHALALVGASTVELRGPDGEVLASLGAPSGAGTSGDFEEGAHTDLPLTAPNVSILRVWTSRYTPFFGRDDVEALSGLAAVADLAFERCRLFEVERELRATADASREEAERANLAKSEFLARMSHELRTPLNVILGFAQILETSDLIEEDREAVAHMIKAGHHLLELINEVLDLSRIESGRLSISVEPVQADDIVRESLSLIQPVAAERGITIHEDLSECDVFVHADRQRSKQVLLNLLSNAVKYNRDKGQIIVSGGRSGDRLFVTVSDTGPGLPEGSADKLFQPFERLGADRLGIEGTGLGLALSKQLVELMGGELSAVNLPGQGASFTIELPIVEPPAVPLEAVGPEAAIRLDVASSKSQLLLLIEDNLSNVHLIERILKQRPAIGLMSAMQAGIGLELAREHQPDVILLDLHLPDLPGAEVLHRLRADPETRHLPVVIVSAQASPGQVQRLLEAGAIDYLTKPLDLNLFLTTIDKILSGSRRDRPATGLAG